MRATDTVLELFPRPADWRARWVRVTDPPVGTFLRVQTPRGRTIEGTLTSYERVRAGVLVTIETEDGAETFVVPQLEVTIPLPLDQTA